MALRSIGCASPALHTLVASTPTRPARSSIASSLLASGEALVESFGGRSSFNLNCVSPTSRFNALTRFPAIGSTTRLSPAKGPGPHRKLRVEASTGGDKPGFAVRETIIPDPDFRIPLILLGVAGALVYTDHILPAGPFGLLGLLLLVQVTRVKFVFDDEALEVKIGKELEEAQENVFVGGKNRWNYSSFIEWQFWWKNFPVLVYFKTKPDQIHFFPVYFNGKQVYDVLVERAGPPKSSGPK